MQSVQLVRGGASDLYGSSAIGGVLNVIPARPTGDGVEMNTTYGGEETFDESMLAQVKRGPYGVLVAGGANWHGWVHPGISRATRAGGPAQQRAQPEWHAGYGARMRAAAFVWARQRNERFAAQRTLFQFNKTRVVRYATGADWQNAKSATLGLRLYGSDERFRQTFSSISNAGTFGIPTCTYRCGETPTKFSFVPDNELGAATHWNQPLGAGLLLVAGQMCTMCACGIANRALGASTTLTNLRDHQRDQGAYVEAMWVRGQWTATASARMDWFQNYDGQSLTLTGGVWVPSATQPTQRDERPFDPRLGLTRKLGQHWALSASDFAPFAHPAQMSFIAPQRLGARPRAPITTC